MKTVLITGGAGFIGSHLCRRFVSEGYRVIAVDNLVSGSRQNILSLQESPQFAFIKHDVCQPMMQDFGQLDGILHFASPASPNPNSPVSYINHPIETLMVNTLGTQRLLELAHSNNCPVVLASTSEVYGDPEVHPQPEEYVGRVSPNGPRSCYDEGKRAMEALAFSYYRLGKTKIKVIRIFNTYGPNMRLDDGRFIPTIVDCAINNKPFERFGDGSATRSFCYIDDLVEGIWRVFTKDNTIGEVINLGNPTEYKINDAIKILEETVGTKLTIKESPSLPDDPQRRRPDISKAKKLLRWEPKFELKKGLSQMLKHYAKN